MKRSVTAALAIAWLAVVVSSPPVSAAGATYYHRGTFAMGGGFNFPTGEAANYLNSSGTLYFAGGKHLSDRTSVEIEWTHNWLAIDPAVLQRASSDSVHLDNAYASSWSVTLNCIRRFHPDAQLVPWVTGGIGYYKRNLQLTQNVLAYYPPVWDPWWGWIDGGWGPGEVITGHREQAGFGYNVGVGFDMPIDAGAALFVDARYHQAFMDGVDTQLIPITFGIRW